MKLMVSWRIREYLSFSTAYFAISVFFFIGLLLSRGDVAQQDLGIPLTVVAAQKDANSLLHIWSYNGFGGVTRLWGFPSFPFINALLAPFGFFGGAEIKLLAVFLVGSAGITMYALARSFDLGYFSSFLSGLLFMSTAVLFDWLMFGWIHYLIGYALLPLMILATKKFLETADLRFIFINALIFLVGLGQPTYVLVYPLVILLFVLFESRANLRIILKGIVFIVGSTMLYLLTALGVFLTMHVDSFTFYYGNYFGIINAQFQYLAPILNPMRLWGSTFAYQFETYFPKELILLSFLPLVLAFIGMLLKPRDRRLLFFTVCYLFVFVSYEVYANLEFLVFNVPYGAVFEAPNIFLAPAAMGLAFLVGFAHESFQRIIRFRLPKKKVFGIVCSVAILVVVVLAGFPWWSGQTTGIPVPGPATKLNLYEMPQDYTQWSKAVGADDEFFVLYITSEIGRAQILNTDYFSQMFQGVNGAVYTEVNALPNVAPLNSTFLIDQLFSGSENISEQWGNLSIKYVVLYKNVDSGYTNKEVIARLSYQTGMVKLYDLENVIVFRNDNAKPVVYSDSPGSSVSIVRHDPTLYEVRVASTKPYLLTLNQFYSVGWTASVDGVRVPASSHIKDSNGFNSWYIDQTGSNRTVTLYYEPQTSYLVVILFSAGVVLAMVAYIVIATVLKARKVNRSSSGC
jgi:hypothetical protein